jgi:hypothetical protein
VLGQGMLLLVVLGGLVLLRALLVLLRQHHGGLARGSNVLVCWCRSLMDCVLLERGSLGHSRCGTWHSRHDRSVQPAYHSQHRKQTACQHSINNKQQITAAADAVKIPNTHAASMLASNCCLYTVTRC